MVLKIAEVIFNDSSSKYNKDLTEFLKRNMEPIIIRAQIKFKFTIAQKSELDGLRKQGIKRLPAMLLDDKTVIGVTDIIEILRHNVKKSKTSAIPKSPQEVLEEFHRQALGDIPTNENGQIMVKSPNELDQEPDGNDDSHLQNAMQAMHEQRRKAADTKPKKAADREPPPKPDRKALNDNDIRNRKPTVVNKATRADNLSTDENSDDMFTMSAMEAMKRGGSDAKDMDMMAVMLAKMGDE